MGVGVGVGQKTRSYPPPGSTPPDDMWATLGKLNFIINMIKNLLKLIFLEKTWPKSPMLLQWICAFYLIAYMGLYLKKCRKKRGWIWKKMCFISDCTIHLCSQLLKVAKFKISHHLLNICENCESPKSNFMWNLVPCMTHGNMSIFL